MHQRGENPAFALDPASEGDSISTCCRPAVSAAAPWVTTDTPEAPSGGSCWRSARRLRISMWWGIEFRVLPFVGDGSQKVLEFHFSNYSRICTTGGPAVPCVVVSSRGQAMVREPTHFALWPLCRPDRGRQNQLGPSRHCRHSELSVVRDGETRGMRQPDRPVHGTMTQQRVFDRLIRIGLPSEPAFPDWTLKIHGDGPDRNS